MQREEAARAEESSSVHTVNAAAVVLAAAARSSDGLRPHHHLHGHDHDPAAAAAAATKKRWWSRLSATLCFRPPHAHAHAHPRRVIAAHGDTPPRPTTAATRTASASASAYVHQAPPAQPVFAFAAPPSSPASSLFQSEAPSPVLLDLHGSSPTPSMFAVGPYARGPQHLVSPPVLYSALTTEPSTAPRTPPATTGPSSPEVPFARFVDDGGHELLFHHAAYQLRLQGSSATPLVLPGPEQGSPSSPRLFRKLHRRSEQGSLLDGHVPVASSCEGADARDIDDDDDEVPDSAGEFVFGNADGRGAAPEEDVDGKNWHFFPMAMAEQHVSPTRQEAN